MDVKFTWIDGPSCTDDQWDAFDMLLATRGWTSLNRQTTRVLMAHDPKTGEILGFNVLQLFPYVGPLYVKPSARGTGVAEDLVDKMMLFLAEVQAKGFLVIAQSPHTEAMCKKLGMQQAEAPVYMMGGTS